MTGVDHPFGIRGKLNAPLKLGEIFGGRGLLERNSLKEAPEY